jgi:hypothetical protein
LRQDAQIRGTGKSASRKALRGRSMKNYATFRDGLTKYITQKSDGQLSRYRHHDEHIELGSGPISVRVRDSSVVIATCYGLDDLGIETRWG